MATRAPVSRFTGLNALLALALLAALSGCGPGPSDNAPSLESRASVGGPEAVPLASENGTGSASGRGTVPVQDRPHAVPVPFSELVIPDWMAKDLASPEVQVRLQAVDRWAQSAPTGSVDPLIQALEDTDEQVQARALELIVEDWAREQAAKP